MDLIGNGISFISFTYLGFLAAAAAVRYCCPQKAVPAVLLLISWAFYCTWNPVCLVFLLITTVSTYFAGRFLGRRENRQAGENPPETASGGSEGRRNVILVLTLSLNIGLLVFCKYRRMIFPDLPEDRMLPMGISFYTLQALGYVIDTYRFGRAGKRKGRFRNLAGAAPEKNFVRYALFISFFPGILSGPIERAGDMLPQYRKPGRFDYENLRNGLMIMVWGYFLKLVLADRIAIVVNTVYSDPDTYRGTIAVLAVLLYSVQIYCDFAGYSAIAIGSARVLGFRVMQNFEAPYLAGSIAEFWRRWHISLSSWFRDYLYIPLGGNRKGTVRKYLNVMIVFAVSGLWHGADLSFLVWGLIHGIYQVTGYILKPLRDGLVRILRIDRESRIHRILKAAVTFLLVSFAWIFFRADSTGDALHMIRCLKGVQIWKLGDGTLLTLGLDTMNWILLAAAAAFLLFRDVCVYQGKSLRVSVQHQNIVIRWILYLAIVMLILICGIWGPGYDSASFIYSQF